MLNPLYPPPSTAVLPLWTALCATPRCSEARMLSCARYVGHMLNDVATCDEAYTPRYLKPGVCAGSSFFIPLLGDANKAR